MMLVTLLVPLAICVAWCLCYDAARAHRVGFAYAERLFKHPPGPPFSSYGASSPLWTTCRRMRPHQPNADKKSYV